MAWKCAGRQTDAGGNGQEFCLDERVRVIDLETELVAVDAGEHTDRTARSRTAGVIEIPSQVEYRYEAPVRGHEASDGWTLGRDRVGIAEIDDLFDLIQDEAHVPRAHTDEEKPTHGSGNRLKNSVALPPIAEMGST